MAEFIVNIEMSQLVWKPIYLTGIAAVDRQHQKLVGYMNYFFLANFEYNTRVAMLTLDA